MQKTAIEWTDFSANPLKFKDADGKVVWGCIHASEGCRYCYSEALAKRYGRGGPFDAETMKGLTPFLDDKELHKMLTAKRIGGREVSGSRCFVGDMTDVFGPWVTDETLDRLFAVFALRPDICFQVLTKRAERMRNYCSAYRDRYHGINDAAQSITGLQIAVYPTQKHGMVSLRPWPPGNVWLGCSAEDQKTFHERLHGLVRTPGAVRFLSLEPLLGPISIPDTVSMPWAGGSARGGRDYSMFSDYIHLVIVGGESGPKGRPMIPQWARSIRDQCAAAGVAFFFKQWGEWAPSLGEVRNSELDRIRICGERMPLSRVGKKAAGRSLDGREWNGHPAICQEDGCRFE